MSSAQQRQPGFDAALDAPCGVALLHDGSEDERQALRREVIRALRGAVPAPPAGGRFSPAIMSLDEAAHAAGVQMYMTLQTLWGFVQMHVYETGREILELARLLFLARLGRDGLEARQPGATRRRCSGRWRGRLFGLLAAALHGHDRRRDMGERHLRRAFGRRIYHP